MKKLLSMVIAVTMVILPLTGVQAAAQTSANPADVAKMEALQRKQLLQTLAPYRKQLEQLRQQYLTKSDLLSDKMKEPGVKWQQIKPLADQINQILSQMYLIKVKARFEVYQKTGFLMPHRKTSTMKRVGPAPASPTKAVPLK